MSGAQTLNEWLTERPFTLTLSSGFFGFFAHTGVVMALEDAGLRPARLTGSSAGALVAAGWSSGLSAAALADELHRLERADFWDPFPGPGLLRGRKFRDKLRAILPKADLEDCEIETAISTFDLVARRTRVHTSGDINAAVRASCALPGLFWPVKVEGRWSLDGGIKDPWGTASWAEDERVLVHQLSDEGRASHAHIGPSEERVTVFHHRALPEVSPFKLDEGRRALDEAFVRTRALLNEPRAPHTVSA